MIKPSLPKGMRDFSPEEVYKRKVIFSTIRKVFRIYGFLPIETPAMEHLETLTEKYGEEGDKLLFRVLRSGDYLSKTPEEELEHPDSRTLTRHISDKGLRYDLTVPLARYVTQHRNELLLPFKRYQMQPVWRADRPQKGRYREFTQCDADVIGSTSLHFDAELTLIFDAVFTQLGLPQVVIKLNNRKLLSGIAEAVQAGDKFIDMTIAIDKWDKAGEEGVQQELQQRGFQVGQISKLLELLKLEGTNSEKLDRLDQELRETKDGPQGVQEIREVLEMVKQCQPHSAELEVNFTLARGLDYYTGTIWEVKCKDVPEVGSIASGGRYDELTATFGVKDMPGVGISFGADRIYDVMEHLQLFPAITKSVPDALLINFGGTEAAYAFKVMQDLRQRGIRAELYPDDAKVGKQFKHADKWGVPWVITIGKEEREQGQYGLKNLETGQQQEVNWDQLVETLKQTTDGKTLR